MKSFRHPVVTALQGLMLALGIAFAVPLAAAEKATPTDVVLKGDAKCTGCHDETEAYPVLAIGKTKHGTVADQRTPTCTSCHGASEAHIRQSSKVKPDRSLGKKASEPADVQNQACLSCHQGGKLIQWAGSAHATRDATCGSCHQVHAARDKVRDKVAQSAVCFTCHQDKRAEINRPSRHPIPEGKVACSDCHNPHGSAGRAEMVRMNINDTCYSCHMEKRGPFVRNHQPVQEDCTICHNPHGTTAPSLLKTRAPFLCQSCHEPAEHPAAPGEFPGGPITIASSANLLARGCVNCHTNIHGTNNPLDAPGQRVFRR